MKHVEPWSYVTNTSTKFYETFNIQYSFTHLGVKRSNPNEVTKSERKYKNKINACLRFFEIETYKIII